MAKAKILEESYKIEGQLLVVGNNDLLRFGKLPITPYRASTFGPNTTSLQRKSRHLLTSLTLTRIYVTDPLPKLTKDHLFIWEITNKHKEIFRA